MKDLIRKLRERFARTDLEQQALRPRLVTPASDTDSTVGLRSNIEFGDTEGYTERLLKAKAFLKDRDVKSLRGNHG